MAKLFGGKLQDALRKHVVHGAVFEIMVPVGGIFLSAYFQCGFCLCNKKVCAADAEIVVADAGLAQAFSQKIRERIVKRIIVGVLVNIQVQNPQDSVFVRKGAGSFPYFFDFGAQICCVNRDAGRDQQFQANHYIMAVSLPFRSV